jgi:aspartate/methionine/tyrosine aminotransferase
MFAVEEAAGRKETSGKDVIRLTLGKSDLPLHEAIVEAIINALRDPKRTNLVHPEGLPELREALSHYYYELTQVRVPAERILVDAGTSSAYPALFRMLIEPEDEVVLPLPYYPLYHVSALLSGANTRFYRIGLDTLELDYDSFLRAVSPKTRLVVVNSPGNPLGNVISVQTL